MDTSSSNGHSTYATVAKFSTAKGTTHSLDEAPNCKSDSSTVIDDTYQAVEIAGWQQTHVTGGGAVSKRPLQVKNCQQQHKNILK